MKVLQGIASGSLVTQDNQLVPSSGSQMADAFLNEEASHEPWSDQFINDWAGTDSLKFENTMWSEYEKIFMKDEEYQFQPGNPYLGQTNTFEKGVALFDLGNLPESILALEAAVQTDQSNTTAWTKLGQAQAENDQDKKAIAALQKAVQLDPGNLPALISLAVSHTNECHSEKAADSLLQWLKRNPLYNELGNRPMRPGSLSSQHAIQMFLEAARTRPTIDPDIHIGLGLLYNSTWDYDKALECFKAALSVCPDDYALWNKFGATMANSLHGKEHADIAIDAYWRALEKKPSYTRARSNLGISYMAVDNYVESAKCFLGALSITQSSHLWDLLKSSFQLMNRIDLVQLCDHADVEAFRNEFAF
eukprot:TRINITY_DN7759_c0_g1_i4.p1 TRINITY_DN7759_c0_g1~~TRINITY_DN7759_c0_g1_i4.p1  ORF type:complete len:363 (-),score=84.94 TRINITY_DN7759_c0_g1_i4:349-1437(-)